MFICSSVGPFHSTSSQLKAFNELPSVKCQLSKLSLNLLTEIYHRPGRANHSLIILQSRIRSVQEDQILVPKHASTPKRLPGFCTLGNLGSWGLGVLGTGGKSTAKYSQYSQYSQYWACSVILIVIKSTLGSSLNLLLLLLLCFCNPSLPTIACFHPPESIMAATVTLDKAYFETLLRRYAISLYLLSSSSPPWDPCSIFHFRWLIVT